MLYILTYASTAVGLQVPLFLPLVVPLPLPSLAPMLILLTPYPVIDGFLAGSGWLLMRGSFKVMARVQLGWKEILRLLEFEVFLHWFVGLGFALLLAKRLKNREEELKSLL